eukprot:GGOE01004551.1.p1 GENE.GGOE01004551.1~~GGOE01004551.1.p1  ORF type:complete len:884 (-),score=279.30 GGOE01004551.1:611-3262(-)
MGERHSVGEYNKLRKENEDLQTALDSRTKKLDAMVNRVSELEMQVAFLPTVEQCTSAVQCTPPPSRTEAAAQWTSDDPMPSTPPRPLDFSEASAQTRCCVPTPSLGQTRAVEGEPHEDEVEVLSADERDAMELDGSVEFSQSVLAEPEPARKMSYAELMQTQRARRAPPTAPEGLDFLHQLGQCTSSVRQWKSHFVAQVQLVDDLTQKMEEMYRRGCAEMSSQPNYQQEIDLQARLQEAQQAVSQQQQQQHCQAATEGALASTREALALQEAAFQCAASTLMADHLAASADLLWVTQQGCLQATAAQLALAAATLEEQQNKLEALQQQVVAEVQGQVEQRETVVRLEEELRQQPAHTNEASAAVLQLELELQLAEEESARLAVESEMLTDVQFVLVQQYSLLLAESAALRTMWAERCTALEEAGEERSRRIAELETASTAIRQKCAALEAQLTEKVGLAVAAQAQVTALEATRVQQEKVLQEQQATAQGLRDQLTSLTAEVDHQREAVRKAEEEVQAQTTAAATAQQELAQRTAEWKEQEAEQQEEQQRRQAGLQAKLEKLRDEVEELRKQEKRRAVQSQKDREQHEARVHELLKEGEGHRLQQEALQQELEELKGKASRAADAAFARPTMLANRTNLAPEAPKRTTEEERPGSPPMKRLKSQSLPVARQPPAPQQARLPVIALSGFRNTTDPALAMYSLDSRKEVQRKIAELGGKLSKAQADELDLSVTHVITAPSSRTIKCLAAALTGRWVVSVHWVHESHAAGRWVPEGPFGFHGDEAIIRGKRVFLSEQFTAMAQKIRDRMSHCHALVEEHGGGYLVPTLDAADIVFVSPKEERAPYMSRLTVTWEQFIEFIYPSPPTTGAAPHTPVGPRSSTADLLRS